METLFDQIGGTGAVDAAVDLFYDKILADETIAGFFKHIDMDRQARAQKAFLTQVLKGEARDPHGYMARAHAKLVKEQGLNDAHFDAVAGHLAATLSELSVPAPLIDQIMPAVAALREAVLGRMDGVSAA
jgi:hemoglobin